MDITAAGLGFAGVAEPSGACNRAKGSLVKEAAASPEKVTLFETTMKSFDGAGPSSIEEDNACLWSNKEQ